MNIGILTEYYESENYGGVLQAFALCFTLNTMGYHAEQIPYFKSIEAKNNLRLAKKNTALDFMNIKSLKKRLVGKVIQCILNKKFSIRKESFRNFRNVLIPHANEVYDDDTLANCGDAYDAYIVGSDQVWNPTFCHPGYMLDFVNKKRIKMSYAASLGVSSFDEQTRLEFKKSLSTYDGISVREDDAVSILSQLTDKNIECVLDPVLLLSRVQWDSIASNRGEGQDYIFTYFLGEDTLHRKLATEFANAHNLKVISMPYVWGRYRFCDKKFGDVRMYDVSPQDYIALIKNAKFVITDSFHAVVFSCIYQKEFFVFQRTDFEGMSTRLESITKLFGARSHFCDNEERLNLNYLKELPLIDYNKIKDIYERRKLNSIRFLINCLSIQKDGDIR